METKLCRLCGKLGQNFAHIFKIEGFKNKIETCLPLKVSPHSLLPDTVCSLCLENIENFHNFIKHCLQNIIILESQYNIQESCLKSKQKNDKSCLTDFEHIKMTKGTQTEDFLDTVTGNHVNLKDYCKEFPLTTDFLESTCKLNTQNSLVGYSVDSDSDSDYSEGSGKVFIHMGNLTQIDGDLDNALGTREFSLKRKYFDSIDDNIISEIFQRKRLKMQNDIEYSQTKIFKIDAANRRKSKIPKKLETQVAMPNEDCCNLRSLDYTSTVHVETAQDCSGDNNIHQNFIAQQDKVISLPQNCLLCEAPCSDSAALATHIFETHGIDMAEIISSSSAESYHDKGKKKLPNLVKISDLKRSDSLDENQSLEDQTQEPPTLLPSFACPNCPAIFTNKSDLSLHIRVKHSKQAAFLCGLCMQQCMSYVKLRSHLQLCSQKYQPSTRYICKICYYGEDNFKSLESHVLVHDFLLEICRKESKIFDPADYINDNEHFNGKPQSPNATGLICGKCGLNSFDSFKEFSSHRRTEHSIYHCDLCNKFYGRNSHLWKHVNRLHKGHPSITCQLCYKTSASKYHLAQHFNKIHLKQKSIETNDTDTLEKRSHSYDLFQQDILTKATLFDPIMSHLTLSRQEQESENTKLVTKQNVPEEPKEIDASHDLYTNIITNYTPPSNEGDFKCPKCSKAFDKKLLLKKHKKNCRPKMQKDLLTRCKSCSRIFKDRQSLAKHLVNYHSEYVCEICNQKVQSKCEIVSHIRFQHPSCDLFCRICKNILRCYDDMKEHLRCHLDSYICQFCGDSLPSKIKLKMHILSLHRKILSLSCGICLKLFENQHILKDHVTLVHKNQLTPLTSCPVCGKNYGSKWKTYDHLNKSHGNFFKTCKTCLKVFNNDAQLQAHCDVTSHGNPTNFNTTILRDTIMAQITSAIHTMNNIASNEVSNEQEVDESEEDHDDNTDESSDENETEQASSNKLNFLPYSGISLLEKQLLENEIKKETVEMPKEKEIKKDLEILNTQNTLHVNKLNFSPYAGISLLEKQLLENEIKKETIETTKGKEIKRDLEILNTQNTLHVNSSKRTVYVNSNDPSRCEICFKSWPAKKHLWQHYIRCHKSVAATVCGICLKTNDTYELLQKHLKENHPKLLYGQGFGSNFICKICGRYHNASSKLRLHMVIHENFDWKLLEECDKTSNERPTTNGVQTSIKQEESINYESLIEQVECSQSDNEFDAEQKGTQEDDSSSDSDSDDSSLSGNFSQDQLLDTVKQEPKDDKQTYYSNEDTSSSTSECSRSESFHNDESQAVNFQNPHSNSNTVDSELHNKFFRNKPAELDTAIKSISYEYMESPELNIVNDYCDLQPSCLSENEIESAVDSIL